MVFTPTNTHGWKVEPNFAKYLPLSHNPFLEEYREKLAGVLIPPEEIEKALTKCFDAIATQYQEKGTDTVTAIYVLKGARKVFGNLVDGLFERGVRTIEDTTLISRYGSGLVGGDVRFRLDLIEALPGDECIAVEDIVDDGITLGGLVARLDMLRPKGVNLFSLLQKDQKYRGKRVIDYPAFFVDDHWFVGYGMDLTVPNAEGKDRPLYRDLPFVAVANPEFLLRTGQIKEEKAEYLRNLIQFKED